MVLPTAINALVQYVCNSSSSVAEAYLERQVKEMATIAVKGYGDFQARTAIRVMESIKYICLGTGKFSQSDISGNGNTWIVKFYGDSHSGKKEYTFECVLAEGRFKKILVNIRRMWRLTE